MEWAARVGTNGLSVVPETNLFHHRPGWKVAVDLNPAPTAAGTSTVTAWPSISDSNVEESQDDGEEEEEEESEKTVYGDDDDDDDDVAVVLPEAAGGGVGGAGAGGGMPSEFTAGKMVEIVVQARDVYGNLRGVGACQCFFFFLLLCRIGFDTHTTRKIGTKLRYKKHVFNNTNKTQIIADRSHSYIQHLKTFCAYI